MAHPRDHQERVEAWLAHAGGGASSPALVALLQGALDALWRRAQQTLGDVTVRAIVSRALVTASSRHPLQRALMVDAEGVSCAALAHVVGAARPAPAAIGPADPAAVRAAVHDVLVEVLTVLGDLTANILTGALHDALMTVTAPEPGAGASRGAGASAEPD